MIYNLQVEKPTHLLLTYGHGIVLEAWPKIQWLWLKKTGTKQFHGLSASSLLTVKLGIPSYTIWLVVSTPLKNITLYFPLLKDWGESVGVTIPNIWKHKKCSKPPTSHGIHYFQTYPRILRNSSCVCKTCKTPSLDENPTWHLTMLMPHLLA